jgi:hypothetical protein
MRRLQMTNNSQAKRKESIDWESCIKCGDDPQVETSAPDGMFEDGDVVRCPVCGEIGQIVCDSETSPYVSWD